jgi:hypothetical protein
MLSMSVYAPTLANSRDADDGLAINFGGSKRWLTTQTIDALSKQCLMTALNVKDWKAKIAVALIDTADEVLAYIKKTPEDNFAPTAHRMLELWAIGLDALDSKAAQRLRNITSAL